MLCLGCGAKLKVVKTYSGAVAKTNIAKCSECGRTHTLLTINLDIQQGYGYGAYALLKKLEEAEDKKEAIQDLL